MLRAYCDASASERVLALAGYVGSEEQWAALEDAWRRNLDYWELDVFNLTDLPGEMGHTRAGDCIASFAHLIRQSDIDGVSSGVEIAFWNAQNWDRSKYPTPYHTAVDMLLDTLSVQVGLNFPPEPLALVPDKDGDERAAQALYDLYRSSGKIGSMSFSDCRTTVALQCADLAVGVVRKQWMEEDYFARGPNPRRIMSNAIGKRHFGNFLSYKSDQIVRLARASLSHED